MDRDEFEVVYGPSYFKSILGILKICEIISCLFAIILVAVQGWTNELISAFYAGNILGIIISLVIFVLCLTGAGHSLKGILKFQFVAHVILFIYLLVVSSLMLARWYSTYHRVGGVFGLLASFLYLVDAAISYQAHGIRIG